MCLTELRDRVLMLPELEKRMRAMINEIRKAEDDVSKLLRKYEQESRDVESLQSNSFSSFLLKLVGKHDDKLERKQYEEIDAKIEYDRAVVHLESLVEEKEELAVDISALKEEAKAFSSELDSRRARLSGKQSEPNGIRYAELENERKAIISQITSLETALKIARRAKSTAQRVSDSLRSAQRWATYRTFSKGGLISHAAKYSHIDEAEKNFNTLSHDLRELKSVLGNTENLTEISSGQRSVDFWFSNIFTSISVRQKIVDNAEQVNRLIIDINRAESALNSRLKGKQNELAKNKQQEEELLIGRP